MTTNDVTTAQLTTAQLTISASSASTPAELRRRIRQGLWRRPTSGLAPGFVQCNLVVLAQSWADSFLRFCQANPRPCPLLAMSEKPGDPRLPGLGNLDVRSDIPAYRVFRAGVLSEECDDIRALWQDDFVAFALGCSFSFEEALIAAGLEVRNVTQGVNVPMYRTDIPCQSAGPFRGDLVVSMRPFKAADAIRAIQICSRFPAVHGAPVHLGDPAQIGIARLGRPDFGDPVPVREAEIPLFWACGVTPQVALEQAAPALAITHSPGCMLITDRRNAELAVL